MKQITIVHMIACLTLGFLIISSDAAIDPGTLVGLWLFDDGNGDVAEDSSGNNLDGVLMGNPKWVDGEFGKALELNGVDAYVEVPAHSNPRDEITVSIWVKSKTENWNQHGFMVEKRDAYIIHPVVNTKNVTWALCNGGCWNQPGGWADNAVGPDDIKQWHMYTTTFDSATGRWVIYIDGKEESSWDINKTPLNADSGPVFIGRDTCCGGRFGNVFVDEVAIFSVALEQADIETMMKNGLEQTVLNVKAEGKMTTTWGQVKTRY